MKTKGEEMNKEYLGDGVYVEIEHSMFKLTTEDGSSVTNTIYLEPQVFNSFMSYVKNKTVIENQEQ